MEVDVLNMHDLFIKPLRYEIPPFQRQYVWTQRIQWEPLWEDIQNAAEVCLEQGSQDTGLGEELSPHFLGAIVLQQRNTPTGRRKLETRLVVDGQQRLTTLQLLLDAIQEVFEQRECPDQAARLGDLVLNKRRYIGTNDDHAFKVWPTMTDQEAFRYAMDNDLNSEDHNGSPIVQAHDFFKYQTIQWLGTQPHEIVRRAEALEQAVTELLELVVIDLDQTDDPHIIFETLNARGTPLLQSDLVKNMVLFEAGKPGIVIDAEIAGRLWSFTDSWWSTEIRQGRLYRPRIDAFLNYWLVMRKRQEVTADKVFAEFRNYYEKSDEPIDCIGADIGNIGSLYRSLEEASVPDMAAFLYRRGVMDAGVLTPVLLWLLSSGTPKPQLQKSIRALESYIVRRMVCRIASQGQNRLFVELLSVLENTGAEYAGDCIVEYLGNQKSNVGLWPNDRDFQDAFANLQLYRLLTRGRLRLILEGLEEELRTDMADAPYVPRNLTIEHIMPQQWHNYYPLPDGVDDENEAREHRNQIVHTLGNLTLVNQKLNSKLSDAPWGRKQQTLNDHITLFLNKDLLKEAPDVWDESAIAERSKRLCEVAMKVWPHADDINRMTST